jgi:hypothetical protein
MELCDVPEAITGSELGYNLNLNDVGAFISIWALVVMPSGCHEQGGSDFHYMNGDEDNHIWADGHKRLID